MLEEKKKGLRSQLKNILVIYIYIAKAKKKKAYKFVCIKRIKLFIKNVEYYNLDKFKCIRYTPFINIS